MGLFRGKIVIVTGGGGSIGRAASLGFAAAGAQVVVSDLNAATAEATCGLIREQGGEAMAHAGDISAARYVEALVADTVSSFGGLDCAFNNAGMTHPDDLWDEAVFRRILEVNLVSQFLCMKYQIPEMLKRGQGAIVNMASVAGLVCAGGDLLPGYHASKHGVIGLTKTAAIQYARQKIRVNALCPGTTQSEMLQQAMDRDEKHRQHLLNHAPMGRIAEAAEIAAAAIWLCSENSSFVTGHSMVVDGGFLAK